MSLRAKIEAVVYAAEEPVTLAQLATVFADEVRELQRAASPSEAAEAATDLGDGVQTELLPRPERSPEPFSEPAANPTTDPASEADSAPLESVEDASAASEDADAPASRRAARQEEHSIREYLRRALDELIAELDAADRGVEIREIAGGYRMATRPEYHDAIRSFVKSLKPPMKLSLQALETLAVVAYKQPVTAPEISAIRGVESAGVLGGLLARKLITTAGRKQVIGRPILYKTTREFLLRFGLKDLNELPSMEEFEKIAGELESEMEPAGESVDRAVGPQGASVEGEFALQRSYAAVSTGRAELEEADTLLDGTVLEQEAAVESLGQPTDASTAEATEEREEKTEPQTDAARPEASEEKAGDA